MFLCVAHVCVSCTNHNYDLKFIVIYPGQYDLLQYLRDALMPRIDSVFVFLCVVHVCVPYTDHNYQLKFVVIKPGQYDLAQYLHDTTMPRINELIIIKQIATHVVAAHVSVCLSVKNMFRFSLCLCSFT